MVAMDDGRRRSSGGEQSTEHLRACQSLRERILERFSEGSISSDSVPFLYGSQELDLRLLSTAAEKEVRVGLFLPDARYSRMTLVVDEYGAVTTDNDGVIPEFDLRENEPDFSSANLHELAMKSLEALLAAPVASTVELTPPAQALSTFLRALTSYDFSRARDHSTSDLLVVENGSIHNQDQIFGMFEQARGSGQTRTIKLEVVNEAIVGSSAVITYRHNARVRLSPSMHTDKEWIETAFLREEQGSWKVAVIHSSKVKHGSSSEPG